MHKEKKEKHFLKKPIYEGGVKAMKAFVKDNLKYPQKAFDEKVEGSVNLRYSIDYKGKVTQVKVVSGIGSGCDKEAIRIVKMFEFEVPKTRKAKVLFHKKISIHFRLPKQVDKPVQVASQVQYLLTPSPEKQMDSLKKKQKKKDSGSYSYSVTIS